MIELALLLPIAAIGFVVWSRKRARLDALLLGAALDRVRRDTGREIGLMAGGKPAAPAMAGRGAAFVLWLAADGALRVERLRDARAASARADALTAAGCAARSGELVLSEWEPLELAGAGLARAARELLGDQ